MVIDHFQSKWRRRDYERERERERVIDMDGYWIDRSARFYGL